MCVVKGRAVGWVGGRHAYQIMDLRCVCVSGGGSGECVRVPTGNGGCGGCGGRDRKAWSLFVPSFRIVHSNL